MTNSFEEKLVNSQANEQWVNKYENIPMNINGLSYYNNKLGMSESDWKEKKVLDLGAGSGGIVAKQLKDQGINENVISLSPHYQDKNNKYITFEALTPEEFENQKKTGQEVKGKDLVAGYVEDLPFKDKSFDLIVSVLGVPFYLNSLEDYKKAFSEIYRVLCAGGEGRFNPAFAISQGGHSKEMDREEIIKILQDIGFTTDIIPDTIDMLSDTLIVKKSIEE